MIDERHPAVLAAAEVIEQVRDEWWRSEEMKPPRRLQAQLAIEAALPHLDVITVYRRMEAAAAGAREERDIMRAAVEAIVAGDRDPVGVARAALAADRARREANLAALAGPREPSA